MDTMPARSLGLHDDVCLKGKPGFAIGGAALFGVSGLIGIATLHHKIDSGLSAKITYSVIAITCISFLMSTNCRFERALCTILVAIFAVDSAVAFFGIESSSQLLFARATVSALWLVMALICVAWAVSSVRARKSDSSSTGT